MPPTALRTPRFRDLTLSECKAMLARHNVGRIAYEFRGRVNIEPIHFVYSNGEIACRTAPGSKFEVLRHNPWVAFEVDEVDGTFDWRSVVARGTVYRLDDKGSRADVAAYRRTVRLLRRFVGQTLRAGDPVPFRDIVLGVYVNELSGRAASTRRPAAPRRGSRSKKSSGARRRTPLSAR